MEDCLFCKIVNGDIPSKKIYEDETTYAFYDISPQAKIHALVVPKQHTASLAANAELTDTQLADCLRTCHKVAEMLGIDKSGYRVVSNAGDDACQTVHHLHFHVIGGNQLNGQMA